MSNSVTERGTLGQSLSISSLLSGEIPIETKYINYPLVRAMILNEKKR